MSGNLNIISQKQRNMIIIAGYLRVNFSLFAPKLVLYTIMQFFNDKNIIPCNVFDWKKQISYQNVTTVYVNSSAFFFMNGNGKLFLNRAAQRRVGYER